MTPEALATQEVREAASVLNARVFRNNAGACKDSEGNFISFGLGNDGSKAAKGLKFGDYVGFTPVVITSDMIGKTLAVFTNLEIKPNGAMDKTLREACREGSREYFQWKTIQFVLKNGGLAGFVTNKSDVEQVLNVKA